MKTKQQKSIAKLVRKSRNIDLNNKSLAYAEISFAIREAYNQGGLDSCDRFQDIIKETFDEHERTFF